ncbi:MAG: sensory transduction histidine kinase [Cyanobacteria bacterium RYN_339]|nr:sensory transduction histidine kinase [Cyanobacteria bacterium RYN_339]
MTDELARLRAENQQLRAQREHMETRAQAVIDQALFSIQLFAPDGSVRYVNRAFEELWGLTGAYLVEIGYNIRQDEQLAAKGILPLIERAFQGEAGDLPVIHYDPAEVGIVGRPRYVGAYIYPVKDQDGQVQEVVLVHQDVTAREEAELELRRAMERLDHQNQVVEQEVARRTVELRAERGFLQTLLDNLNEAIVACDATGALTLFNPAARLLHGQEPGDMAAAWSARYGLLAPDGETPLPMEQIPLYQALHGGTVRDAELVVLAADGRKRTLLATGRAIVAPDGEKLGAVVAMRDVTEAKQTEVAIQRQNESLTALNRELTDQRNFVDKLLDNLPAGMAYYGPDLRVRRANPEYARLFNRTMAEVEGKHVLEIFGEPGQVLERILARIVETGEAINSYGLTGSYSHNGRTYAGTWDVTRNPVLDADGAVAGVVVLMMDVTERARLSRELEAQRALTERLVQHAPLAIAFLDHQLIYRWNNPMHQRLFGGPETPVVGRHLQDVIPASLLSPDLLALYERVLATGEAATRAGVLLEFGGAPAYWDMSYIPVVGIPGEPPGILVFGVDATGRLHQERAQRDQIAHLQEVDQLKDRFLSILSHELRTPLNAIMGFASILDDEVGGPVTPVQHQYLGKIIGGTEILLALINDLLDMSRIQAGKFSLEPSPMRLEANLQDVTTYLGALADRKAQALRLELPDALPAVLGDAQRVTQVLANLIGNAIKFTPRGGTVRIRAASLPGFVRVEVADDGPGIPPDQQGLLFQPFSQLDSSSTRAAGGAGLGLSIAKALVEAHGGRIGVESAPGQGSVFWFTLPALA